MRRVGTQRVASEVEKSEILNNRKNMTYEKAIKRLEEIVRNIESGETDIDTLSAALKEAKELVVFCKDKLTKVEEDVNKILGDGNE